MAMIQRKTNDSRVVVQHDLEPFECSKETAEQYKHEHGEKCEILKLKKVVNTQLES